MNSAFATLCAESHPRLFQIYVAVFFAIFEAIIATRGSKMLFESNCSQVNVLDGSQAFTFLLCMNFSFGFTASIMIPIAVSS